MKSHTALLLTCACWTGLAPSAQAQLAGNFTTYGNGCTTGTTDSGPVLYTAQGAGAWSMANTNLTFASDGASWSLQVGGGFIEPSAGATQLVTGPGFDDVVIGPLSLPFTFDYPGGVGSTTAIDINTNGRIYLEAGTNPNPAGWNANDVLPDFLGATPSVCALAVNLDPSAGGGILFETRVVDGLAVAVATWDAVPEFTSSIFNTFQCQLWETGEVVLSYGAMAGVDALQSALIGCSAGGGAPNPGVTSFAAPPWLSMIGSPTIGGSFSILANRVPATTAAAILAVGASPLQTPLPLSPFGTPSGCSLLIDQIIVQAPMTLSPPLASVGFTLSSDPALAGASVECQALLIDPALGTPAPVVVSDAGTVTIGTGPTLRFVVDGENSYYGSPGDGGFFRLESAGPSGAHPDITGLEVSFVGTSHYFDVEGNAGTEGEGHFDDGNGFGPTCKNAYYGSDLVTGLVYGAPFQPSSCDGTGTSGWVGSASVGGSPTRFRELAFEFADFAPGETFGFDCDTDGGDFGAGVQPVTVTVTFADASQITAAVQFVAPDRAEGVLIP